MNIGSRDRPLRGGDSEDVLCVECYVEEKRRASGIGIRKKEPTADSRAKKKLQGEIAARPLGARNDRKAGLSAVRQMD